MTKCLTCACTTKFICNCCGKKLITLLSVEGYDASLEYRATVFTQSTSKDYWLSLFLFRTVVFLCYHHLVKKRNQQCFEDHSATWCTIMGLVVGEGANVPKCWEISAKCGEKIPRTSAVLPPPLQHPRKAECAETAIEFNSKITQQSWWTRVCTNNCTKIQKKIDRILHTKIAAQ